MRKVSGVLAFVGLLLIAGVTEAPAIAFNTVGGFGTCLVNACVGGPVEITPHPGWTPNIGPGAPGPGPVWVSYAQTGFGGIVAPNAAGLTPAQATETFEMVIPAGFASLSLLLWADDTVGVRLDGVTSLLAPSAAGGQFSGTGIPLFVPLDGLAHTMQFDTYQLALVTHGVMVQGELAPVPEPATLLLLGSTLAGVGALARRRLRKKQQQFS